MLMTQNLNTETNILLDWGNKYIFLWNIIQSTNIKGLVAINFQLRILD